MIVGGGVRYSEAGETVEKFCEEFKIPFGETQAGKSACKSSHPYCLGGIGVTGTYASNIIAEDADVVIAIGSRMSDFTTSSKRLFKNPDVKFVTINNCRFHAYKMDAVKAVGDAKVTVEALTEKNFVHAVMYQLTTEKSKKPRRYGTKKWSAWQALNIQEMISSRSSRQEIQERFRNS